MKVSLLIVATNKYIQFVPDLIASAKEYFLTDCEVTFHVFTDQNYPESKYVKRHLVEHKPHPYPTLMRYHFFSKHASKLHDADYLFYIDADCLFKSPVTDEILSDRVGTQHCGFVGIRGSYETNPESKSYVSPNEGTDYYGGGFWGFSRIEFFKFIGKAKAMIDTDLKNGIVPVWHDESVLNRYLIDNPPTLILSPAYHYPQSEVWYFKRIWKRNYECKILLLDKNHEEIRA